MRVQQQRGDARADVYHRALAAGGQARRDDERDPDELDQQRPRGERAGHADAVENGLDVRDPRAACRRRNQRDGRRCSAQRDGDGGEDGVREHAIRGGVVLVQRERRFPLELDEPVADCVGRPGGKANRKADQQRHQQARQDEVDELLAVRRPLVPVLRLGLPAQARAQVEVVVRLEVDQVLGRRVKLPAFCRLLRLLCVALVATAVRGILAVLLVDAREEHVAHSAQCVRRPPTRAAQQPRGLCRVAVPVVLRRRGTAVVRARLALSEPLQQAPACALPLEALEQALARVIAVQPVAGRAPVRAVVRLTRLRVPAGSEQAASRAPCPEACQPVRRRSPFVAARREVREDGHAGATTAV